MITKPWIADRYAEDYVNNAHREAARAALARDVQIGSGTARWRQLLVRALDRLSNELEQAARELGETEQARTGSQLSLR